MHVVGVQALKVDHGDLATQIGHWQNSATHDWVVFNSVLVDHESWLVLGRHVHELDLTYLRSVHHHRFDTFFIII